MCGIGTLLKYGKNIYISREGRISGIIGQDIFGMRFPLVNFVLNIFEKPLLFTGS